MKEVVSGRTFETTFFIFKFECNERQIVCNWLCKNHYIKLLLILLKEYITNHEKLLINW